MANEKISQLPTVANATLADLIPAVQGGQTVQETLQQVLNLMLSNLVANYPGNPNSNVAGKTFQLCWDTVDELLWICTVTGTSSIAVWVSTSGIVSQRAGVASLSSGVAVVANTGVTSSTIILITGTTASGGTIAGELLITSQTPSVGFTITSSNLTDNGSVNYFLVNTI